jgi:predicted alpha/beta superfamily hydrolase
MYVALPKHYHQEPTRRYPVLYCHDGHNLFYEADSYGGATWGMQEEMALPNLPSFIVVALSCAQKGNHRLEEYNMYPGSFPSHPLWKIEPRGKQYLDYLLGPFKDEIDQTYRTLPEAHHTFMMGSSMGGVISLEAAYHYDHKVQHIAGLSNAFYVSTPYLETMIQDAKHSLNTIYLDTGDQEEGLEVTSSYLDSNRRIQHAISHKGNVKRFRYEEIQGGTHHESSWQKRLPSILKYLFQDYQ